MTTDSIGLANFAIAVSGLTISILGLLLVFFLPHTDKKNRRSFFVYFLLLAGYAVSTLINQLSQNVSLSLVTLFLESLFSSCLMPGTTLYLLHCAKINWKRSPLFALVMGLWFVYFVLLVITQFTTQIYYYTSDNEYHRGPWYPLLLIPPVLLMLANIIGLCRSRHSLTKRQRIAFLIYFVLPMICMVIQMFFYGLLLIVLGTTLAILFMYVFLLIDQLEHFQAQQQKIAQQRANVMVLQMRPHFIYNTLMSIYSLCNQDPGKARAVTMDFTNYLRKNFNAVAASDTVPFTAELEHTKSYLAVEQAQHEEMLVVEYDVPFTNFRLPPLTLQPLVENAVKHGMNPYAGPLHITVRTRHTEDGSVISVEDTGPGFDPIENTDPHLALTNIKQRLEMMCSGELKVSPRNDGGTTVTVTIPDKKTRN